MTHSKHSQTEQPELKEIWLLNLVPKVAAGRWLSATVIFVVIAAIVSLTNLSLPENTSGLSWSAGLFFCVIVAYIVPIFQFITQKTEQAFDAITNSFDLSVTPFDGTEQGLKQTLLPDIQQARLAISHKTPKWIYITLCLAIALWLLQSWFLSGGWEGILLALNHSMGTAIGLFIPLLIWLTMLVAITSLVDNARLFRRVAQSIEIDVYNTQQLHPFGNMAVSSTLVVIGSQASFSLMWLEAGTDPWTTTPGLITTSCAIAYLFFAPTLPIHRAIKTAKRRELTQLQAKIDAIDKATMQYVEVAPLLTIRREIQQVSEWPFDLGIIAKFILYLVIVPMTWIGAALIENVVDFFIS